MGFRGLFEVKGAAGWVMVGLENSDRGVKGLLSCMKGHGLASGYGDARGHRTHVGIDCTHLSLISWHETPLTYKMHCYSGPAWLPISGVWTTLWEREAGSHGRVDAYVLVAR